MGPLLISKETPLSMSPSLEHNTRFCCFLKEQFCRKPDRYRV